jgi:hypothetical protein
MMMKCATVSRPQTAAVSRHAAAEEMRFVAAEAEEVRRERVILET